MTDHNTQPAEKAITHLAFYAGWPRAMSAMAVAKQVFGRQESLKQGDRT